MEGICIGKGIVIVMNLISGLFPYKTRGVVGTIKRNVSYNETAEISFCFCSIIVRTTTPCFVWNNLYINFIPITIPFPIHIPSIIY